MLVLQDLTSCVCICCPLGCQLEISFDELGEIEEISGQKCKRGEAYARQEAVDPLRMVTAVLFVPGSLEPLSVKTAQAIPKQAMAEVLQAISACEPRLPIRLGDVVLADVCGTGVDVIATKDLD